MSMHNTAHPGEILKELVSQQPTALVTVSRACENCFKSGQYIRQHDESQHNSYKHCQYLEKVAPDNAIISFLHKNFSFVLMQHMHTIYNAF